MTTLIDARERFDVGSWETSGTVNGVRWSVSKRRLAGGRQDGVDLIEVDNGAFRFVVVPTRGMGLWDAHAGDLRIGWDAPCAEIVHPKYIDLESRGGLGWLEGFGEWVVRCGLENNGSPGTDTVINNNGDPQPMTLPLHGKIANIPASFVSFEVTGGKRPVLTLKGVVIEAFLFGPNLALETTITTEAGSLAVTVEDTVINRGDKPAEFELLYHCNYGPPILEAGARIALPVKRITPRDARAVEYGVRNYAVYPGPTPGITESCYFFSLYGDKKGVTAGVLHNKAASRGILQRWNLKELPCFTLWKNPQGLHDGYVTGMEPGTNYPNGRGFERAQGRVPKLRPGKSHTATITYEVLPDAKAVKRGLAEVKAIQGGRKTTLDEGPDASICE